MHTSVPSSSRNRAVNVVTVVSVRAPPRSIRRRDPEHERRVGGEAHVDRPGRRRRGAPRRPPPRRSRPTTRREPNANGHRVTAVHAVPHHVGQAAAVLPVLERGARPLAPRRRATPPAPLPHLHRTRRTSCPIRADRAPSRHCPSPLKARRYRDADASAARRRPLVAGAARRRRDRRDRAGRHAARRRRPASRRTTRSRPPPRAAPTTDKNGVQHLHFEYGPLDIKPGQNIIETDQVPDPPTGGRRLDRRLPAQPPAAEREDPAGRRAAPPPRRVGRRTAGATPRSRSTPSGSSPRVRRRPRSSCPRRYGYRVQHHRHLVPQLHDPQPHRRSRSRCRSPTTSTSCPRRHRRRRR